MEKPVPYDGVDELWAADVDVRSMTTADLTESRATTVQITLDPEQREMVGKLADVTGLDPSATLDHVIRLYLAYLMDTSQAPELRGDYDVYSLIPMGGWTSGFEPYDLSGATNGEGVDETINVGVPDTVHDMMLDVVASSVATETEFADLAHNGLAYATSG